MSRPAFRRELPDGYVTAKHLNAKDLTFGLVFNGIAFLVLAVVMVLAFLPLKDPGQVLKSPLLTPGYGLSLTWLGFLLAMVAYIVLHELVHGIFYRALTGEKLTFGLSWSCAFCGVPHIYVSRRVAILSASAPLVIFSLVLLPLTSWLFFVDPLLYLLSAFLFGMHLGGCSGDVYLVSLLLLRYRHPDTLVRDTGPEQFICLPQ